MRPTGPFLGKRQGPWRASPPSRGRGLCGGRRALLSPSLQNASELVVMRSPVEAVRLQQSFKFTLCQGSKAWFGVGDGGGDYRRK